MHALSDTQQQLLAWAYEGSILPNTNDDADAIDGLVDLGLLEPDEDEYEVYGYDVTEEGAASAEYAGLV